MYSDRQKSYFFIQVKSTSLHETRQNPGFLWYIFPVYRQNGIRISPYMDRIYDIRENTDTILSIYGKIRTRENSYFDIFHPVGTVTISVMFILTLNWVTYICILYFGLAYFSSLNIQYSLNKTTLIFFFTFRI